MEGVVETQLGRPPWAFRYSGESTSLEEISPLLIMHGFSYGKAAKLDRPLGER